MDALLELVTRGLTVYDLSHRMEYGMPRAPVHPEFRMTLVRRHGDAFRPDGTSASSELIITGGHVGTHVDALAHFSLDGKLFGGADAEQSQRGGRHATHGIDAVAPRLCRAVLLDVAGAAGVEWLPGGHAIGPDELARTVAAQGVQLRDGDVVLVRTGWSAHYGDVDAFRGHVTGVPGVDEEGARWLADQGAVMQGSDTINYEVIPPGQGSRVLPVHRLLLVERGINILEICDLDPVARARVYEFTLVLAPLNIVGATGAPARLLALTSGPR